MKEDKAILLASQRDPSDDDPEPSDVYEVGDCEFSAASEVA